MISKLIFGFMIVIVLWCCVAILYSERGKAVTEEVLREMKVVYTADSTLVISGNDTTAFKQALVCDHIADEHAKVRELTIARRDSMGAIHEEYQQKETIKYSKYMSVRKRIEMKSIEEIRKRQVKLDQYIVIETKRTNDMIKKMKVGAIGRLIEQLKEEQQERTGIKKPFWKEKQLF